MAAREHEEPAVGRLEWGVAALGAAITIAVFAVLGYEAATFEEGPPVLVARVLTVSKLEGGHVVQFEAQNLGDSTAAEVVVRATLKAGEQTIEEAEATLDYVARKSRRKGGLIFRRDPGSATLEIAAVSYRDP